MSDLVLIWDKKFENENTRFYCASIIKKIHSVIQHLLKLADLQSIKEVLTKVE